MNYKKVLAISTGYTVTVISDEYDADNPNQSHITVSSLEQASQLFKKLTELFQCSDDNDLAIGNLDIKPAEARIKSYLIINGFANDCTIDNTMDWFNNIVEKLGLNGTEDFYRVCRHCTVTYSPVDIYVDEILISE